MKRKTFSFVLLFLISSNFATHAQNELKSSEVNVFKNGTYFIVKEGSLLLNKGKAKIELPAAPLLSTYWITTSKDIGISKITYMYDTIKKPKTIRSFQELLMVNTGQRLTISAKLDDKNNTDISGVLLGYSPQYNIAKIRLDNTMITYVYTGDIRKLTFDKNPNEKMVMDSVALLGNIEFNKTVENTKIKLVYMQAGIQWIPSYNVKILNENELQIEMRALVENFAEKIEDAGLTLTVGDPEFKYGRNTEQFISGYLTNIAGVQPQTVNKFYAYQNVSYTAPAGFADQAEPPEYDDYTVYTTAGEKTNDLYMYSLGKVSMPKNSKTSFQIFSQKVPYKDVYTADIGDVVNYSSNNYINIDPEKRYDVYHSLQLTNSLKNPFTTGPVFVENENLQPLAQDEIKYTPPGGRASIQLSKAVDVAVKNNEEEIKKTEKAKAIGRVYYNKVTVKGSIEINNLQDKKIVLNLSKSVDADITETSDNGSIKKPGRYTGLNPFSRASWELPLSGHEKKTVTYQYDVYVVAQ